MPDNTSELNDDESAALEALKVNDSSAPLLLAELKEGSRNKVIEEFRRLDQHEKTVSKQTARSKQVETKLEELESSRKEFEQWSQDVASISDISSFLKEQYQSAAAKYIVDIDELTQAHRTSDRDRITIWY